VILDPQAQRLAQWFAGLQERVDQLVEERLRGACASQLEHVTTTLQSAAQLAGPPAPSTPALQPPPGTTAGLFEAQSPPSRLAGGHDEDASIFLAFLGPQAARLRDTSESEPASDRPECRGWKTALEQDIRPALHRARGTLRAAAAAFRDGSALASLRDEIDANLARQPETLGLDLLPEDSSVAPTTAPIRVAVPLRRWLHETLQPALHTTLADFNARLAAAIAAATSELERIETVLDYHLFIVEDGRVAEQRDESARTGLGHGVRLVQQLAERLDRDVARIYHWFITTSADHMDDALAPLRAHRPDEISHALATRAQRARPSWWSGTSLGALTRGARGLYTKATPLVLELVRDLRGALRDDRPRLGYWDLAIASDTIPDERLPPLYRRLFGEIPLGLADLYQPRPNLETACRRVFETWLSGQPRRPDRRAALLVIGDRGAGKRTLVNRVRAELHGELPVRWLSLGPHLASEARLSAAICEASGAALAESFRELGHALRALGQRQAIVLENAEQLFVRTPEGLGRVQAFLDLVRATDDTILWVVLMAKPAAALLDTCLRLPLYFGEVIRVEPESPAFLEAMVRARHRVSGLGLRFRARRAPVLQRLRAPFTRSDLLADPGEEWFAHFGHMTAGNLQQALQYWQIAARIDPQTSTDIIVRPLPRRRGGALAELSLAQRLVLATLVQHGALTEAQLLASLRLLGHGAAPEIDDLLRRKLIEPYPHVAGHLQLRGPAIGPVTLDLRWRNML
jgi:hypothetical protein